MNREQLQIKYNLDNIDFLSYLRVKQSVQKFLEECKIDDTETLARAFIPNHINVIFKSKKGACDFYESLHADQKNNHIMMQIWNKDLGTMDNGTLFSVCVLKHCKTILGYYFSLNSFIESWALINICINRVVR